MASAEEWHLRADAQVGEGTFVCTSCLCCSRPNVYSGTRVQSHSGSYWSNCGTQEISSVKSTLLNHERLLLQRLQGHSSIPKVLAYGRLKHFEYLGTEFLGMALDDVHKRCPSFPVVNVLLVADQMVRSMSKQ
jgi:hypothetical protein